MKIPLALIVDAAAEFCGVTPQQIRSNSRSRSAVRARWFVYWIADRRAELSASEIARNLGGRDHTTVLHGIRKLGLVVRNNPEIAREAAAIEKSAFQLMTEAHAFRSSEGSATNAPSKMELAARTALRAIDRERAERLNPGTFRAARIEADAAIERLRSAIIRVDNARPIACADPIQHRGAEE